jgi:hypothetical protein
MEPDLTQQRRQAHAYLDRLPAAQLSAVKSLLETMLDAATRAATTAPLEDEPIGGEEQQTVAEARELLQHNQPIPHEEVLAEFGLTIEDFERMGRTPLPPESNGPDR